MAPQILSLIKSALIKKVKTEREKHALHVGIELGGTNYNVAIGRPIFNSKDELMDFQIIAAKDGITYEDPDKVISEIVQFIHTNLPI